MKMRIVFLAAFAVVVVLIGTQSHSRETARNASAAPEKAKFVLVAHGGAGDYGNLTPKELEDRRKAIIAAVQKGYDVLSHGGRSLDAVEAAIRVMEDSAQFDSGRGAFYSQAGVPELDASIMDGKTLGAGSVASVRRIANPIHLARLVMEKTPHVMIVGEGAELFAKSQGIELVSPYYFFTEREWQNYKEQKAKHSASEGSKDGEHGTVGVVALDQNGNLAAGTSTGGTLYKMTGRVGDSPIIGAGTYANNQSCAVSGTGAGEFYIRDNVAADICARVRYLHVSLEKAADDVVMHELVEQHGDGGVIAVDPQGNVATPFNTPGMFTGTVHSDGKIVVKGWNKTAEPITVSASK